MDDSLTRIASSLSALNPALASFAETTAGERKDAERDQVAGLLAGKSADEQRILIKSGAHPVLSSRLGQEWFGRLNASAQADERGRELATWYATKFDKDNGDLSAELNAMIRKDVALFGSNKGWSAAYMERMSGVTGQLLATQTKYQAERGVEARQQTAQDAMTSVVRQAIDKGTDPATIPEAVAAVMKGNSTFGAIPFATQQGYLVESANALTADMERDPGKRAQIMAAITGLLEGERPGEDGVKRRLTDNAGGTGATAREVLGRARDVLAKQNQAALITETADWENRARYAPEAFDPKAFDKWNKSNPGALSPPAQVNVLQSHEGALARKRATDADLAAERQAKGYEDQLTRQDYESAQKGGLWSVEEAKVPTKAMVLSGGRTEDYRTVSADDRRANVLRFFDEDARRQEDFLLNRATTDPEKEAVRATMFGRKLEFYSTNDIAPDAWKALLKGGIRQATTAALSGKQPPEQLASAFDTYQRIKRAAPTLLKQVADDDTRAFYDMAEVARDYGYGDPMQQLNAAATYFAKRDKEAESVRLADVTKAVAELKPGVLTRTVKRVFGVDTLENPGVLTDKVAKFATLLNVGLNVPVEEAIPLALERVRPNVAVVNGYAIDTNDKRLGPSFEGNAEQYLRNVAAKFGPQLGVTNPRELTLVPLPNDPEMFQVVVKNRGFLPPIYDDEGGTRRDIRFVTPALIATMSALNRTRDAIRAERRGAERSKPFESPPLQRARTAGPARPAFPTVPDDVEDGSSLRTD